MELSINTKRIIVRRVSEAVPGLEINRWKNFFNVHGRKTEFQDLTNIPRVSLNNILNRKSGNRRIVKIIRDYYEAAQLAKGQSSN